MTAVFRGLCCWLMACGLVSAAVQEQVVVYGPTPVHTPQTADQAEALRVGQVGVTVSQHQATMLRGIGGIARAPWHVRWRRNAQGHTVDQHGLPTTDSSRFVCDGWTVSQAIIDAIDGPSIILDLSQRPVVQPSTATLGQIYWYAEDQLYVVAVRDGLRFRSQADAAAFRHIWLDGILEVGESGQHVHVPRLRATPHVDRLAVGPGCALPLTTPPTAVVPIATVGGAYLIVPIVGTNTMRYFRERDLMYADPAQRDPYARDGRVIIAAPAITPAPGHPYAVRYSRHQTGEEILGHVDLTYAITVHDLPEPYRSQQLQPPDDLMPLTVVTDHDRGILDGQDMVAVQAATERAHHDRTGAEDLREILQDHGYTDPVSGPLNPQAVGGDDPTLDLLRTQFDPDQIQNQMQAERRNLVQLAPEVDDVQEGGAEDAWLDAIEEVNAQMRPHMEGREAQEPAARITRHAAMHPAGVRLPLQPGALSPDQLGEPIADGDNPMPARPLGLQPQGAPFYDFNGNGTLDRWNTTDPFWGEYRQLVIRWDFRNDYRAGDKTDHDHMWAAYVVNRHGERRLLLAAQDAVRNRVSKRRQGRRLGVTFWGPALVSFLEPIAGRPQDEWRFALRYLGAVAQSPDEPWPPPPEVQTASRTIQREINGVMMPWKTVTETVYCYPDVAEPEDVAGAVWSIPGFTSQVLHEPPTMPAKAVVTQTILLIDPLDPQPVGTTTTTAYFPHDFDPAELEPEPITPPTVAGQRWMWDFAGWNPAQPPSQQNAPWNYQRGNKFGEQSTFGFVLNPPETLQRLCHGATPLLSLDGLLEQSDRPRISFTVRSLADRDPPDGMTIEEWRSQRAMHHERTTGWDERTDMRSTRHHPQPRGERTFDLVEGLGWYLFRGARREYHTEDEHRALIEEMWQWYFRTPETVLQVQRINPQDPHSPLLRTARAQMLGDPGVDHLVSRSDAALVRDGSTGIDSMQAAVERRERLIQEQIYLFSAARGREWEVAYARQMPDTVRLICVEYDCLRTVQRLFSGRSQRVEFIPDEPTEHRVLGEILTHYMAQTPARAVRQRTEHGYDVVGVQSVDLEGDDLLLSPEIYQQVIGDRSLMGRYRFAEQHTLYGMPAMGLRQVAVLDDGQYGSPRPDQWRESWTAEFRHPMLLYYDDRWSAVVIAYGHNTDPYRVFGAWQDHGPVQEESGLSDADRHRARFEAWAVADARRLPMVYDALHPEDAALLEAADAQIPPAPPMPGPQPQEPVPPVLQAVEPQAPAPVSDPGPAPVYQGPERPTAPWALMPYATAEDARTQWWEDPQRLDASRPGHTYIIHGDEAFGVMGSRTPPPQFHGQYWSGPWFYAWLFGATRGVRRYRGWSVLPHATRVVGRGSHHPQQNRDGHVNVVCAMLFHEGPARTITLSFDNDDGGALYWNQVGVHTQYQRRARTSRGSAQVTLRPGWNEAIGTHYEDDGDSYYRFHINGLDWVTFAAQDPVVHLYAFYPPGAPGQEGAQAALERYDALLQAHGQALTQHDQALEQWQAAQAAWTAYQDRVALYEEQRATYRVAVQAYEQALQEYQEAAARYPVLLQQWQALVGPYEQWCAVRDAILAARAAAQTYRMARDAWVLLARTEIDAPGVDWSGPGTPVFQAYDWWSVHTPEGRRYP